MDTQYADRPDGLAGNDDVGQMSAWYVFTALGFYPVAPGSGEYILGRPFLPKTAMRLPNGKTFTIVAEGWMTGTPMWAA
jgi:putative alpha-1,2-mannosidase